LSGGGGGGKLELYLSLLAITPTLTQDAKPNLEIDGDWRKIFVQPQIGHSFFETQ
jgi:hypothetical protein